MGVGQLKAGAAQIDITPPVGIALTGYIARDGPSVGVHDPLHATAIVLDSGGVQVAVISCDLLALDAETVAAVRASIERTTGIPAQHVLIAATHTHSGPATIFLHGCGEVDPSWLAALQSQLVALVQQALTTLQPAAVGSGRSQVPPGIANRRRADGPLDRELGVLRIDSADGQPLAVLTNVGCHATVLGGENRLISADYPGYAARALARGTGAPAACITGAAGDVNPLARQQRPVSPLAAVGSSPVADGFAQAEQLGEAVAVEALRVWNTITPSQRADVWAAHETLAPPLLPPPDVPTLARVADEHRRLLGEAQAAGEGVAARVHAAMLAWAQATLQQVEAGAAPRTVAAEVQTVGLGPLVLVGVPGELFSTLGTCIRAAVAPRQVFVCAYTNDDIGYIPSRDEYAHGGYEILEAYRYYGYPAALAPEAGEMIVAAAARLGQSGGARQL